ELPAKPARVIVAIDAGYLQSRSLVKHDRANWQRTCADKSNAPLHRADWLGLAMPFYSVELCYDQSIIVAAIYKISIGGKSFLKSRLTADHCQCAKALHFILGVAQQPSQSGGNLLDSLMLENARNFLRTALLHRVLDKIVKNGVQPLIARRQVRLLS